MTRPPDSKPLAKIQLRRSSPDDLLWGEICKSCKPLGASVAALVALDAPVARQIGEVLLALVSAVQHRDVEHILALHSVALGWLDDDEPIDPDAG